jgi:hypothetical protein
MWVRQTEGDNLDSWLDYYERLGITHITMGAVIMRKRSGAKNWLRLQDIPEGSIRPAGEYIRRLFRAEDFIAALPAEEALLDARLKAAPDHVIRQELRPGDNGDYAATQMTIEWPGGLGPSATLDLPAMRMLSLSNGERTLREIVREIEGLAKVSTEEFTSVVIESARAMLRGGFLIPEDHIDPENSEGKEVVYGAST